MIKETRSVDPGSVWRDFRQEECSAPRRPDRAANFMPIIVTREVVVMSTSASDAVGAVVVVRRPSGGYRDRLRSYRITVDGAEIGRLERGHDLRSPVEPGVHEIRAAIDWSGSPAVRVDLAAGETVGLTVRPAGSALLAVFQIWRRDSWLKLSIDPR